MLLVHQPVPACVAAAWLSVYLAVFSALPALHLISSCQWYWRPPPSTRGCAAIRLTDLNLCRPASNHSILSICMKCAACTEHWGGGRPLARLQLAIAAMHGGSDPACCCQRSLEARLQPRGYPEPPWWFLVTFTAHSKGGLKHRVR